MIGKHFIINKIISDWAGDNGRNGMASCVSNEKEQFNDLLRSGGLPPLVLTEHVAQLGWVIDPVLLAEHVQPLKAA